ncbi:hypothetical protein WHR41_09525 [Cladosporium halotolerans]|uniref:phosphogluconate dehydrogenase (NADP(+)-dependent, decarboxylating) n=1 Tax=Cladosporium halotolerans TaxID=1052096 RepID=A0AB34KDV7_9PEZI
MSEDAIQKFRRIGIVGAGNMGTEMAMAFSEMGLDVSLWDVNSRNVDEAIEMSKSIHKKRNWEGFHDVHDFVKSLESAPRKLFMFSITHGSPADSVLEKIKDDLAEGDIIIDGGNEHFIAILNGGSGYQAARRGPSMTPGGERKAVEEVLPLLERYAAKDSNGNPCVGYIGPKGSGHYVKMVHNGIENGFLSTLCEAWSILRKSLDLSNDEVGKIFERWNSEGELKDTYLVQIGSEICQRKKTPEGDANHEGRGQGGYVLDDVLDKVVQDDDDSEGTLFWSIAEAADRHVSFPTNAAGQFFRVASGDRDQRLRAAHKMQIPQPAKAQIQHKDTFIENLRRAVFASFLCAYCQGLELIARASKDEGWDVNLGTVVRIWRAGCIIKEEYIVDMLQPIFTSTTEPITNMKLIDEVSAELHKHYQALQEIVLRGVEWHAYVPSLSASLEYIKYTGGTMLATQFMEAEMDFFGAHNFDRPGVPGEDPGKAKKGSHHYEWRPA